MKLRLPSAARSALWNLAFALCLLSFPLQAQDAADASAGGEETVSEATVEVPPSLASARATVRTFLEAFDDAKRQEGLAPLQQAASTLDVSHLRVDVRQVQAEETAWQLKQILDRTERIDFDDLSDDPEAKPWILPIENAGAVEVARGDDGAWRFTQETVDDAPTLLQAVRDQDIVEGVTEARAMTFSQWLRERMPSSLQQRGFLLEHWQWVALFVLILLGVVLRSIVVRILRTVIERYLAARMESLAKDEVVQAVRPIGWFAAALLWWFGILWLGLPNSMLEVLIVATRFIAAVTFVVAAYRLVEVVAAVLEVRAARSASKADDLLVPLFRKSAKLFIVAFGLLFLAETLELPVRSLIAGLGIGGLAVALAAQDAIKNFFGSLMIIFDRPFSVGDWVLIDGHEGTVVELGFRSTRIRTFYDSIITLPNSNLINAAVDNYGRRRYRRWKARLTLDYRTPPDRIDAFCEGVRELIRRHPHTRKDYYEVHLNAFGDSALEVLLYVFFTTPNWSGELQEKHSLAMDILRLAENLGVDFAFPTQTLFLERPQSQDAAPTADFSERRQEALDRGRHLAAELTAGSVEAKEVSGKQA